MRNKVNVLLAAVTLVLAGTAYGLCYLDQVVCCAISGDNLGNYGSLTLDLGGGSTTAISGSFTLYSDSSAYRFDTYSVSRGGFGETAFTSYCDPIGTVGNEYGANNHGAGNWQCHYYNANNGATGTCYSSDPNNTHTTGATYANYSVTSHFQNSTTCP